MINRSLLVFSQRVLGLCAVAAVCMSCASQQKSGRKGVKKVGSGEPRIVRERKLYSWPGDPGGGKLSVRIDLADQRADFLRSGKRIGWTMVATGVPEYPTPTGSFRVTEKLEMKRSGTYGVIFDGEGEVVDNDAKRGREKVPKGHRFEGADMPYWQRLTATGIGMHAGFLPNPGEPASHGCIRMPKDFAPIAFRTTTVGTPVTIVRSQSDDPAEEYEEKMISPYYADAEEEKEVKEEKPERKPAAQKEADEVEKEQAVKEEKAEKKTNTPRLEPEEREVARPQREMPMPTSQSRSQPTSASPVLVAPRQFIRRR
jgi:lipoprotein-anchoring transpeptidase ErfK/SrfK